MEIEYKFLYPVNFNHEIIVEVFDKLKMREGISVLSIAFEHITTKYLDGKEGTLRNSNIAVRNRFETKTVFDNQNSDSHFETNEIVEFDKKSYQDFNYEVDGFLKHKKLRYDSHILSFKWGGFAENGLHKRCEEEIDLTEGKADFSKINPEVYKVYRDAEKEGFVDLFTTMIRRVKLLIKFNESRIEVCIDKGFLIKNEQEFSDITEDHGLSEIELELNQGTEEDLKALADFLSDKFSLIPNEVSKYQRGLNLYDGKLA